MLTTGQLSTSSPFTCHPWASGASRVWFEESTPTTCAHYVSFWTPTPLNPSTCPAAPGLGWYLGVLLGYYYIFELNYTTWIGITSTNQSEGNSLWTGMRSAVIADVTRGMKNKTTYLSIPSSSSHRADFIWLWCKALWKEQKDFPRPLEPVHPPALLGRQRGAVNSLFRPLGRTNLF